MTALQDVEEKDEGNEQLAGALCALAERLLGNAKQLETVTSECEQLLERAQKIFPDSPEPLQVLSFTCKSDAEDARIVECSMTYILALAC